MANNMGIEKKLQLSEQRAQRYRIARDTAERLLEEKASELFASNQALVASQQNLKNDIAQATYELQTSNTRLTQALEEKSSFIGSISHEIRTPLNAVIGLSELLLDMPMEEQQKEYANTIYSSSKMLFKLLNDVLDISKIEAGKLELRLSASQPVSAINSITKMFDLTAASNNSLITHDISSNVPQWLLLDEGRYSQIITNLMSNAIKNTKGGKVSIALRYETTGPDEGILTTKVSDTGVGIAPKLLGRIFTAYEQFGNLDQGAGLGLAICKHLSKLMQGTLSCDSELGKGTVFTLRIPTQPTSAINVGADPKETIKKLASLSVLAAEDNTINQAVLKAQLSTFGITPVMVNNGKEALEKLSSQAFDITFLDIQMPVMDGEQTITQIKNPHSSLKDRYCVALTAASSAHQRQRLLNMGFDDFLSKPVLLENLEKALSLCANSEAIPTTASIKEVAAPIFDLRFFEAQFGESATAVFKQLAPVFLGHAYPQLDELRDAIKSKQTRSIHKIAHSLKGSVASFGLEELRQGFEQIEKEPDSDNIETAFDQLVNAMLDVKSQLEQSLDIETK